MKKFKVVTITLFLSFIGCAQEKKPRLERENNNNKSESSDAVAEKTGEIDDSSSLQSKKLENFDGVLVSDDSVNVDDQTKTKTPSDGFSGIDIADSDGESIFYDEDGNDKTLTDDQIKMVSAIDGVEVVEVKNDEDDVENLIGDKVDSDDEGDVENLIGNKDDLSHQFEKVKISNLNLLSGSESFHVSQFDELYTPMVITFSEKFSDVVWDRIPNFEGLIAIPKTSDVDIVIEKQPSTNLTKRTDGGVRVENKRDGVANGDDKRFDSRVDDTFYKREGQNTVKRVEISELRQRFKAQLLKIEKTNVDPAKAEVIKELLDGVEKQIFKEKLMRFALPVLFVGVIVELILILGLSSENEHLKGIVDTLQDESKPKGFGFVKFNSPTEVVILGEYDSETDTYEKLGTMVLDGSIGSLVQEK